MGTSSISTVEIVITVIILVFLAALIAQRANEVSTVKSSIDGRRYLVRNLPDKKKAADMLASINQDAEKLIEYMKKTNPGDKAVRRLARNFRPENVSEASDKNGYTSFTQNKGEKMVMCIRNKDKNATLHDRNLVTYVFLHELAHCMTSSIGHTPEFWDHNRQILEAAIKLKLYKKVDFSKKPTEYCGIKLSSSVI
jgi:hypothetical protein